MLHVTVKIWSLAEHTQTLFGIDSVCNEIISTNAQQEILRMLRQRMLKILWSAQKSLFKIEFLSKNKKDFWKRVKDPM